MIELNKSMLLFPLITLLVVINACGIEDRQEENPENSSELHVAAATSLRFALEEIGQAFEAENKIKVIFQFGSSGNLAQQISSGAPVDLFLSADQRLIENFVAEGVIIEESASTFAIGRIVLAVNRQADLEVQRLEDLLDDNITHISIANPSHAPYGQAAKEALKSKGLWDRLEEKVVYGETVTQVVQYIQTGNSPVGIIALSSADLPEIEYFLVDDSLHNPLLHMLGVVSRSEKQEQASEFIDFINSFRGREIMKEYGFNQPESGGDAP